MKTILVPTDFSKTANNAARLAAQVAKKTNAQIIFLHIVDLPVEENDSLYADGMNNDPEAPFVIELMKLTKRRMEKFKSQSFLEGVNVKEKILYDKVYDAIATQANELKADFIILGTHGISGMDEVLIGSNAEKVIRLADMPVIAVKQRNDNFNPKNIVFASTFYGEINTVFSKIRDFAEFFGAKIHLLKVVTPGKFETTKFCHKLMDDFATEFGLKNFENHIYNHTDIEDGILEFCNDMNADMLAIATHGRTGLSRIINGSLAEELANHASLPLLSIRIKDKKQKEREIFPS